MASPVNCSMERNAVKSKVGETVGNSDYSPALQKVIDRWDELPDEIKQTILTLIKHVH